jgi:hypothetical protein
MEQVIQQLLVQVQVTHTLITQVAHTVLQLQQVIQVEAEPEVVQVSQEQIILLFTVRTQQ